MKERETHPVASKDYILLSGNANPKLAHQIGENLGKEIYNPVSYFSDGEIRIKGIPNVRRRPIIIIQPTAPPVNERLMELILMIDASKRSSASEITAIVPYFGYSRQDRKEQPRVPISASVVANMIVAQGADRILTVDLHSKQTEGSVRIPWDNLYGNYVLIPEIKKRNLENLVIASPDKGGMSRATDFAQLLSVSEVAVIYKQRDIDINNKSEVQAMIGNVRGKNVLLVDDMIDSGGTIFNAADHLVTEGAKSIKIAVTHGLFTGNSLNRLADSGVDEVIVTDTVNQRDEVVNNPKITIVSIAHLLSEAIKRILNGQSISQDLILKQKS